MLLDLLKNFKQAALSHALSTSIVVQGVAVQQTNIEDFSAMEAEILESSLEQREQEESLSVSDSGSDERYWQEISEMAFASESNQEIDPQAVEPLAALYDNDNSDAAEYAPTPTPSQKGASPVASSSLVAISNVGPSAPAVSVSSGERSNSPSRAPAQVGVGSANNLQTADTNKAVEGSTRDSSESSSTPTTSSEPSKPKEAKRGEVASAEVQDNIQDEVSQADSDGEVQEETPEEEEEPTSFEYLSSVFLVVNGEVSDVEVTDNLILELESGVDYSIVVVAEEDFGSVAFQLENIESLAVHNQIENQIPFALHGDRGADSSINPHEFEGGSYQLDLTAYDGNGVGGDILERRTIRFSVTLTDDQPDEASDSED